MKTSRRILVVIMALSIIFFTLTVWAAPPTKYVSALPAKQKGEVIGVQFNFCNFGDKKMEKLFNIDTTPVWVMHYAAKLLSKADYIVIQEVSVGPEGAQAVAKFLEQLNLTGSTWDYYLGDRNTGGSPERAVVFFKTSFGKRMAGCGLVKPLQDRIVREPLGVQLRLKDGRDFWIYSFHLLPKYRKPINEVKAAVSIPQAFHLQSAVFSGDFNLKHEKIDPYFEDILGLQHQIDGKTSLGNMINEDGNFLSEAFDNIYTTPDIEVIESGIIDFVTTIVKINEAKKFSDHLPVFIRFRFK